MFSILLDWIFYNTFDLAEFKTIIWVCWLRHKQASLKLYIAC